jgi:hypothetical protein
MKVNFESIYEHVGYLFYGLACRNGDLSTAQSIKLTDLIETTWRPTANGDPGIYLHLVDCIHGGISYALENGFDSEEAMLSFSNYYQNHSRPFGEPLKEKILATAAAIVKEFPAWQQSELKKIDVGKLMGMRSVVV